MDSSSKTISTADLIPTIAMISSAVCYLYLQFEIVKVRNEESLF